MSVFARVMQWVCLLFSYYKVLWWADTNHEFRYAYIMLWMLALIGFGLILKFTKTEDRDEI